VKRVIVSAMRSRSLATQVYERLRLAIIARDYKPGEVLNETALAASFECSKTPVREALRRLQSEELVEVIPFKGYLVTQASLRDAQDLLELRAGLEGQAAELAASRALDADLDRLEALAQIGFIQGDPESHRIYNQANRKFHLEVARAARNQRLYTLVETVFDQLNRLLMVDLSNADPAEVVREHQDLVQALRLRRPAHARKIMMLQILRTRQRLLMGT
jgi:DNA-binding GntR family transcriptional regulator